MPCLAAAVPLQSPVRSRPRSSQWSGAFTRPRSPNSSPMPTGCATSSARRAGATNRRTRGSSTRRRCRSATKLNARRGKARSKRRCTTPPRLRLQSRRLRSRCSAFSIVYSKSHSARSVATSAAPPSLPAQRVAAAAYNVRINHRYMKDAAVVRDQAARLAALEDTAAGILKRARDALAR